MYWFVVLCDKWPLTMDCVLAVVRMASAAHQAAFFLRFVNVLLHLTTTVSSAISNQQLGNEHNPWDAERTPRVKETLDSETASCCCKAESFTLAFISNYEQYNLVLEQNKPLG